MLSSSAGLRMRRCGGVPRQAQCLAASIPSSPRAPSSSLSLTALSSPSPFPHTVLAARSRVTALVTVRRSYGSSQLPYHATALTRNPHTPQPFTMSTEDCQGYEEALRVFSELGHDVYVHHHADREDVDKVVQDINDAGHPCVDSKTMFLKSKKGELVMAIALQSTKTDMKRIQRETGTKDLRFAAADVLMENLHVVQGCVTPFSLVNNVDKKNISLIVDKNLVESPVAFVMRPCRNDRSAVLKFPELKAFLDKLGYAYAIVDFDVEPPAEEAPSSPSTQKAPKEKKQKGDPKPDKPE